MNTATMLKESDTMFANAVPAYGYASALQHIPNEETREVIAKAERGEDLYGPYYTVESLMEALNADD